MRCCAPFPPSCAFAPTRCARAFPQVELACDLLELSLTNEPLPPEHEQAVMDAIEHVAAEHGVPTGKNEAVVIWRVRAAQYLVRVVKCAAPWPAVLVELTQPHALEATKRTEARPYYPAEDGGSTREERTAQAIARLVQPFAAEALGETKTFCVDAPVLAWDATDNRWLPSKIVEVLEQQQAGKNAQGMDANAFFASDADRCVGLTPCAPFPPSARLPAHAPLVRLPAAGTSVSPTRRSGGCVCRASSATTLATRGSGW